MIRPLPSDETLEKCLRKLLRPIIHFSVRYAQSFHVFTRVAKELFVEAAAEELSRQGEKVNVSRISVLTDIYRVEVKRIFEEGKPPIKEGKSIIPSVISRWESDPDFTTQGGKPRTLAYKGSESEFAKLCSRVSSAINPGTLLFELERIRAIDKTARGIRLTKGENRVTIDVEKGFSILEQDLDALVMAVEENLFAPKKLTNLHIHTEYDNIRQDKLEEIRQWMLTAGKEFHRKAREFLTKYDLDIFPAEGAEGGGRVALGAFSFVDNEKTEAEKS